MQIMTATTETKPTPTIALRVNYGLTLEQMIAAGKYDWGCDDITAKRFSIEGVGTGEFEAKLFHFDRYIPSDHAKSLIEEAGYEPAKIEHLLAFGAAYPDEQWKYPIVALGSVGEIAGFGFRFVPCLCGFRFRRDLSMDWWSGGWDSNCRFLVVRRSSRPTPVPET